jgi:hypothetical protein
LTGKDHPLNIGEYMYLIPNTIASTSYAAGKAAGKAKAVIIVLNSRFGSISQELKQKIKNITDLEKFDMLLEKAVFSSSIEEFEKFF